MPLTPVIEGALDLLLPLQTPAYADPITLLYSNQPALPVLTRNCSRTGGRKAGPPCTAQADFSYHNYNWIPQVPGGSPQGEKPGPFHAEALYSVGFHVGVPAPAARAGVLYSTGTGPDSYAYATRARHGQQDLQLGQDAVAHFRDSLVVFPEDTAAPGTARKAPWMPSNPTTRRQGDQDLVLRMADAAAPDARYVEVGVAQGSPFAQLEVRGVPRLVVGAVFPAAKVPSGPAHPAQLAGNASQPDPTTPLRVRVEGPNGGSVMVQMVYQQVGFGFENIVDPTRPGSSVWASTAVIWDPDVWGTAGLQGPVQGGPDYEAGSRYYWMSPQDPARPAHLVLAPLASQLANLPRGAGRPQYDLAAAAKWAQALAPFAFNFHSGASRVDMYQGESPSGDSARPNEVHVVWTPALVARGPAAVSATTSKPLAVSLLQPIHYLTTFKDGRNGTMPLQLATHFEPGSPWAARVAEGDGPFLQFGGERVAAKYNKYWVSRGVLEAYVSDAVHCSFVAPASVPFFPSQVHAPQQPGTDYVKTGAAPNDDVDFKLNDLLYVLISSAGYELATGTDTGPAASKMGVEMNEPYGAGQAAYYTAKMLHQLRGLQEPSDRPAWFPAANPDCSADCIRQREELEGGLMGSLRDFFALWWEEQPGPKLLSQDGVSSSFTYAMYDNTTHHLTLFPAGTAAVEGQPQSVQAGLLTVDAFGVATKLSDHHYAYGYHIAAAALLGLAEQAALGGSAHPPDRLWHTRDRWGPLVDMLIQDIAFVRSLHEGRDVEWWVDEDHFRFPRLENMDTWTGIAWTDAFVRDASGLQHNANNEAMLAWAGTALWGRVTQRPALAELGTALLTLATYASDVAFLDTGHTFVPAEALQAPFGHDHSEGGVFLPRASADMPERSVAAACWNSYAAQTFVDPATGTGTAPWQRQPFWPTPVIDDGAVYPPTPSVVTPCVYQSSQATQGEDGGDLLSTLFNVVVPLEPLTLGVVRDGAALRGAALNAVLGSQGAQPYYPAGYASVVNVLLAAAGLRGAALAATMGPAHADHPGDQPCGSVGSFHCAAFAQVVTPLLDAPGTGSSSTGRETSGKGPYEWYWELLTGGRIEEAAGAQALYYHLSINGSSCPTDVFKNTFQHLDTAGTLTSLQVFKDYGPPQLDAFPELVASAAAQSPGSTAQSLGVVGMAFFEEKGQMWTFVTHNLGGAAVEVEYRDARGPLAVPGPGHPAISVPAWGYDVTQLPAQPAAASEDMAVTHTRDSSAPWQHVLGLRRGGGATAKDRLTRVFQGLSEE